MRARDVTLCLLPPAAAFAIGWATAPQKETDPAHPSPAAEASSPHATLSPEAVLKLSPHAQVNHIETLSNEQLRATILAASKGDSNPATYLAHLAAEELGRRFGEAALEIIEELPSGNTREVVYHAIVSGWSDADPLSAARWILKEDPQFASQIVYRIARRDPQLVTELLKLSVMTPSVAESALSSAAAQILQRTQEEASAWLDSLNIEQQRVAVPEFIKALAPIDPARAGELLKSLPVERWENHAIDVAMQWTMTDPAAALAWLETLPPNDAAWEARVASLFVWANADPAAAWEHLSTLEAAELEAVMGETINSAALSHNGSPYGTRPTHGSFATVPLGEALLSSADGNAAGAVREWIRASNSPGFHRLIQLDELRELAKQNPAAAVARVGEIGDGDAPALILDPLIKELASTDPQAALDLAATFPGHHRHNGINQTVKAWAAKDPPAALAHIESMEPGNDRTSAVEAYLYTQADVDPEDAAEIYLAHLESIPEGQRPTSSDHHAANIVQSMFNADPAAAGEWVAGLEESITRTSALNKLHELWKQHDPDTAASRLEALGVSTEEIRSL